MKYFSERERGERPRNNAEMDIRVWRGLQAMICTRVEDGSFGKKFPENCQDGIGAIGTDSEAFWVTIQAHIQGISRRPWHIEPEYPDIEPEYRTKVPDLLDVLDLVEFCWRYVGKPENVNYHQFFEHHHLRWDIEAGRSEFQQEINELFRRNGLIYELTSKGEVKRVLGTELNELMEIERPTEDSDLDRLLKKACHKFRDPDIVVRRESLEALWDAWERLKTIECPSNKKRSISALLDRTAGPDAPLFREILEVDAKKLTKIGNTLHIRHSETNQEMIVKSEHIDYLFHRLLSLISVTVRVGI